MSSSDDEDPLLVSELKRIQTLSQEYELALRSNSYSEFQQKIHCYAGRLFTADDEKGFTRGLQSFRIFATSLLQPDEQVVRALLYSHVQRKDVYNLVKAYFDNSVSCSNLCGGLLKSIYCSLCSLKKLEGDLDCVQYGLDHMEDGAGLFRESLQTYRGTENFFSHEAFQDFEGIHGRYVEMEEKLRIMQRSLEKKLRRTRSWNKVVNIALAPVLGVVLISTFTVALVAFPVVDDTRKFTKPVRSLRDWIDLHTFQRETKLEVQNAQVVAAARGTFVVAEHLATIQRLVTRSSGEVEFLKDTMRFFEQRTDYDIGLEAVVDQLRTRQQRFSQHIRDLEEHVILFFLSLNRARSLVIQKISCL